MRRYFSRSATVTHDRTASITELRRTGRGITRKWFAAVYSSVGESNAILGLFGEIQLHDFFHLGKGVMKEL
jgi:hypothetical protein